MGYEPGHYYVKKPFADPDESLAISIRRGLFNFRDYPVAGTFADLHIEPMCLVPFKASSSVDSQIAATIHRVARQMRSPEQNRELDFEIYARAFIRENWQNTLNDEDIPSFSEWLELSNYPGGRREYLRRVHDDLEWIEDDVFVVKAFIKDEGFDEPKYARGILSYADASKTLLGRIFHAIDQKTFDNPFFVKHHNPKDYGRMEYELFGMDKVLETDFTSFEAHHRGVFSRITNYWALHMMRKLTKVRLLKDLVSRMMLGRNFIRYSHITAEVDQKLMSGALWTSSANGVLNLIIMSYIVMRSQHPEMHPMLLAQEAVREFKGLFEGDDGICKAPESVDERIIDELGIVLKLKVSKNFSRAKFCGVTCVEDTLEVVKDPMSVLRKFFCLPKKYASSKNSVKLCLLRARALSYKCSFGDCPIIGPLCDHVLKLTASCTARFDSDVLSYLALPIIQTALEDKSYRKSANVTFEARCLVETVYGVSVSDQYRIESCFSGNERLISVDLSSYMTHQDFLHATEFITTEPANWVSPARLYTPPLVIQVRREGLEASRCSRSVRLLSERSARTKRRYCPLESE